MSNLDLSLQLQDINVFKKRLSLLSANGSSNGKVLAIDYGIKKIGIAVSDENRLVSFPQDILSGIWQDVDVVLKEILFQIEKYNAVAVVFGFPKKLNGELHDNCNMIFDVAKRINQQYPVLLYDERFSTKLANRFLTEKNSFLKKNKKKRINIYQDDAVSASIILENVLDML